MGPEFALLLGFALLKISVGLTVVWLGLRGGDAGGEEDEPFDWEPLAPPPAEPPPRRVVPRRGRVGAPARGRPVRSPARRPPRRELV